MSFWALRALTIYVLLFTTISTFLIIYNLWNLNNNGNLVLQSIIYDHSETDTHQSQLRKETNLVESMHSVRVKYRPDESVETEIISLTEIIESLKIKEIHRTQYEDRNLWFAYSKEQNKNMKKFDGPLSFYNGHHHNLIQFLLPASLSHRKSRQQVFWVNNDRIQQQLALKLDQNVIEMQRKLILVMYDSLDLNKESMEKNKCNVMECDFTTNLSQAENADAIIFHGPQKLLDKIENRKNQIWVYHNIEAPVHRELFPPDIQVNWSATYRSDSVISTPYAKFVAFSNVSKLPFEPLGNFAAEKTRLAAALISNCHTKNERLSYIRQLQKFARIDVYGSCGDKTCYGNQCFEILRRSYKFYLAFENSNCRDYITEKFFHNALQ